LFAGFAFVPFATGFGATFGFGLAATGLDAGCWAKALEKKALEVNALEVRASTAKTTRAGRLNRWLIIYSCHT
jgi:hypothetical protein